MTITARLGDGRSCSVFYEAYLEMCAQAPDSVAERREFHWILRHTARRRREIVTPELAGGWTGQFVCRHFSYSAFERLESRSEAYQGPLMAQSGPALRIRTRESTYPKLLNDRTSADNKGAYSDKNSPQGSSYEQNCSPIGHGSGL